MKISLFQELQKYSESDFYPFHMPGHKRNSKSGPLADIYKYDITEIDGFDDLHQAEGIIKEVQDHAACLYHSKETYFLVNGSTAGILSAVSAVKGRGRKLIISRNCHKSVYHAAFLNSFDIEYIYPDIIEEFGIADGIKKYQVEEKLEEILEKEGIKRNEIGAVVAGIVITSPTYDGILSDVEGITQIAHSYGIPVIVDQAHGAHFGFHPSFPVSAVIEGADLVIHSVHKTLPAPTQTALLHRNSALVSKETVKKYLRIYQSSSPSYLFMSGIDLCMEFIEKEGKERLGKMLLYRRELLKKSKEFQCIKIYPSMAEAEKSGQSFQKNFIPGVQEPGRLLISVRGTDFTGLQLYDVLKNSYHLQMEMYAADYVIAILSMMDEEVGFVRLSNALCEIDEMIYSKKKTREEKKDKKNILLYQQYKPTVILKISDVFTAEDMYMPLEESRGRIAADFVNLYPPGIPMLVPGEELDDRMIEMLKVYSDSGYAVQGVKLDQKDQKYYLKVIQ